MHNRKRVVVATAVCATLVVAVAQGSKIDFEKDDVGKPPKGFSFALTGQGKPGVWIVKKDDQAHGNVLVQTDADRTDYRFPVAVYDDFTARTSTCRFNSKRSLAGSIKVLESSGGIVTKTTITSRAATRSRTTVRFITSSTGVARRSR